MAFGSARSTNSDVYSFACVALFVSPYSRFQLRHLLTTSSVTVQIIEGKAPFGDDDLNDRQVCAVRCLGGKPMEPGALYPAIEAIPGLHDLLLKCWAEERVERPSMPTVIDTLASF